MEFSLAQFSRDVAALSPREHGFSYLAPTPVSAAPGAAPLADAAAARSDHYPEHHCERHLERHLEGWVLSAKDLNDVMGMPTSLGAAARTYMPSATDPFLQELLDAGAVLVGKSASSELGLRVDAEPEGLPHPDNPLWPGRTPGGSSGGAAVQVARGLLRAAHATDGGGSIRVPAAACGVVGFKPSGEDLSVQGFITHTVADQARLHGLPLADAAATRPRIGVLLEPLFAEVSVDPVMRTATLEAAAALRAAGYETVGITRYPEAAKTFEAFRAIFSSKLAKVAPATGYVDWVKQLGRSFSASDVAAARNHAAHLPYLLAHTWQVDAIVSPMLSSDPPAQGTFRALPHQENFDAQTRWSPWGSLFNVARLPAISIPWPVPGRAPVGVQLGGITLDDAQLLALATALHP